MSFKTVVGSTLATRLFISSTGAATFSGAGSFTGNTLTVSGNNPQFYLSTTTANLYNFISFTAGTATSAIFQLGNTYATTGPYIAGALTLTNDTSGGISISSAHASGGIRLYTGGATERMKIDINGVLKIGNGQTPDDGRNPGYANVAITYNNTSGYGEIQCLHQGINVYTLRLNNAGGQVYAGSSRLDNISDIRMKTDITSLGETLEIINQLKPKKFHLIDEKNGKLRYGFIAQELEGILDEFVYNSNIKYKDEENGYEVENIKGIENWASSWAALLIKGMQEQQTLITALQEKLERNNII